MFEAQVARFYRSKGYEVHEQPKVRGSSGTVYGVSLIANGPLGALLVSFGDAGGMDAAEIGRVRTMARDIGATPVVAVQDLTPDLRRLAAQMAVVVVDEATVSESPTQPVRVADDSLRRDMEAHPWPASGRAHGVLAGPTMAARDVDDLIADLRQAGHFEPPAQRSASPPATAAAAQVLVNPVPQPGGKFSWLPGAPSAGSAPSVLENPAADAAATMVPAVPVAMSEPVNLSVLLGRPAPSARAPAVTAVPALERASPLVARYPPMRRVQYAIEDGFHAVKDWPWKTIGAATAGGVVLFLAIRALTV